MYEFGSLVASEAQRRGFYGTRGKPSSVMAITKAGLSTSCTSHVFTAITDFVHPVTYLYDVAGAVTSTWTAHWQQYVAWMTDFCP